MKYIYNVEEITGPVHIYGAGMVGRLLYKYLRKNQINVIDFIESGANNNISRTLYGLEVNDVENLSDDKDVIIATLSNSHDAISNNLKRINKENYMAVSEKLLTDMRNSIVSKQNELASLKLRYSEMLKLSKCENEKKLVITDSQYFEKSGCKIISSNDFLRGDIKADIIFIMACNWTSDWQEVIKKAFLRCNKLVISYRYKFLNYNGFKLIDVAKTVGFQLSGSKRFYRNLREYITEDVLLYFEKRCIESTNRDLLCTGCRLCETVCTRGAVRIVENEYGYKKMSVCDDLCIKCGKCLAVCPIYKKENGISEKVPDTYVFAANDDVRKKSSSGGVFGTLATDVLMNKGFVCGAAWKSKFEVKHIIIDSIDDLSQLQLSKYARSDISGVLPEIKKRILSGQKGLCVACPCQIKAIKEFLGDLSQSVILIDLVCAEAPSGWFLKRFFSETDNTECISSISFRDKVHGWRPDTLVVNYVDNTKSIRHMEDISQQAFHSRMMMDYACEHCNFLNLERVGDLTIGDAWGISNYDSRYDDGKGLSIVIANNQKGKELLKVLDMNKKVLDKIPYKWTFKNRIVDCIYPHARRDRFYKEVLNTSFTKAFLGARDNVYDVGIVGNWSYPNYGSELTYFALYHVIKDLGLSVLMIEWPEDSYWKPYGCTQLFEVEPYENDEIAEPSQNHYEMTKYNDRCQIFIQGSDQLLNPNLFSAFGDNAVMDWVDIDKKKIGYSLSIGSTEVTYSDSMRAEISYHLQKFDAVSVREISAVNQMKNLFNVEAEFVLDPVYLCDQKHYLDLIKNKQGDIKCTGVFAYILDGNIDFIEELRNLAQELGEEIFIVSDAAMNIENNRISIEEWLVRLNGCKYFIADSFHGISMAMIFHKKFIAIKNNQRGGTRFDSILNLVNLKNRLFEYEQVCLIKKVLLEDINYEQVDQMIMKNKNKSMEWLNAAISARHINKYSMEQVVFEKRLRKIEAMFMKGEE